VYTIGFGMRNSSEVSTVQRITAREALKLAEALQMSDEEIKIHRYANRRPGGYGDAASLGRGRRLVPPLEQRWSTARISIAPTRSRSARIAVTKQGGNHARR
jgi:hypothetical protein